LAFFRVGGFAGVEKIIFGHVPPGFGVLQAP
jgi:hypothetical protein